MTVRPKLFRRGGAAAMLVAAMLSSGYGEFVRQSRSPSQIVIDRLLTARGVGAVPTDFVSGPLLSDVPDINSGQQAFNDFGQATLRMILKDPGLSASPTAPSVLNDVTITRYTVTYKRSGGPDGRNTPGVDVPRPIDGAMTLTLPVDGSIAEGAFELVRHVAKLEAPLAVLGLGSQILTMIAEVTFYGHDQAGNELSTTGNVQITFANFSDPPPPPAEEE